MDLAKRFVDVGIFTNRLDEMRAFYSERIRLPYEELLPVGGGVRQYRYGLLGSVLKINHARDPLPARIAGGYRMLSISDPRTPMPLPMRDPDGNDIELMPAGQRGVNQIEIHIGVTDEAAFEKFYADALQAERLGAGRFKLGETIVEGSSGGGAVNTTMNGKKQLLKIRIDPSAVLSLSGSQADVEMLEDLVVAAVNDAGRKADDAIKSNVQGILGGLKIPGLE